MRLFVPFFIIFLSACGPDEGLVPGESMSASTGAPAHLSFLGSWHEVQTGELRQGGRLSIHYDLERLPGCRNTHNGAPAWDITAHLLFSPGGQHTSGSVRRFVSDHGVPTTQAESQPFEADIPADATEVVIWFENRSGAGSDCVAWDSSYGENYRFAVMPPEDHPRCKDATRWAEIASDVPYVERTYCTNYDVSAHYAATHCEVFPTEVAHAYMAHYGIPNRWVMATLEVREQRGRVRNAGLFALLKDKESGEASQRYSYGLQVSETTWQTGIITLRTAMRGTEGLALDVRALAFFVDIERDDKEIVRLWQSRQGANYTMDDAFGQPTLTRYIPYGNVQVAAPSATIYESARACGP